MSGQPAILMDHIGWPADLGKRPRTGMCGIAKRGEAVHPHLQYGRLRGQSHLDDDRLSEAPKQTLTCKSGCDAGRLENDDCQKRWALGGVWMTGALGCGGRCGWPAPPVAAILGAGGWLRGVETKQPHTLIPVGPIQVDQERQARASGPTLFLFLAANWQQNQNVRHRPLLTDRKALCV